MKGKGDHRGEVPGMFLLSNPAEMPLLWCTRSYSQGTTYVPQGQVCHITATSYSAVLSIRETGNSYFHGEKEVTDPA